ncbi:MAG: cytochrome-c peroxidase [Myxococcaceae bacterium]
MPNATRVLIALVLLVCACGERFEGSDDGLIATHFLGVADALAPLSAVPVPKPQGSDIVDEAAAVQLGKALFWDVQAGSDGKVACASCHFAAGADGRTTNTLHPGPNGLYETAGVTAPGQNAPHGNLARDDRWGSQGVATAAFRALASGTAVEDCLTLLDPLFGSERQVTLRNTPTVIGAAFYRQLFWDGRASDTFNGVDPFGAKTSTVALQQQAALASQAVGPPTNSVEMSCANRPFNGPLSLAEKLLARTPLQEQDVSPADSVLGLLSASPATGLKPTYRALIAAAFGPALAQDAENQFSRIWGQAIAAYERTLIPDRTPLDAFLRGDTRALTASQQRGLTLFSGSAGCIECHAGPELSDATVRFASVHGLINEDGGDQGFHAIGVRPVAFRDPEDVGRADHSISGSTVDRGAFKTPSLRNVKLTAPYFHNGGKATLRDVTDFYAQGGEFRNPSSRVKAIIFLPGDQDALVEFLSEALTDCRVEQEQAPFDHPSLEIPNGPSLSAVGADGRGACP